MVCETFIPRESGQVRRAHKRAFFKMLNVNFRPQTGLRCRPGEQITTVKLHKPLQYDRCRRQSHRWRGIRQRSLHQRRVSAKRVAKDHTHWNLSHLQNYGNQCCDFAKWICPTVMVEVWDTKPCEHMKKFNCKPRTWNLVTYWLNIKWGIISLKRVHAVQQCV
jgi:hypothetical protein